MQKPYPPSLQTAVKPPCPTISSTFDSLPPSYLQPLGSTPSGHTTWVFQRRPAYLRTNANARSPPSPPSRFIADADGVPAEQQGFCGGEEAGGRFLGEVGRAVRPGVQDRRAQVTHVCCQPWHHGTTMSCYVCRYVSCGGIYDASPRRERRGRSRKRNRSRPCWTVAAVTRPVLFGVEIIFWWFWAEDAEDTRFAGLAPGVTFRSSLTTIHHMQQLFTCTIRLALPRWRQPCLFWPNVRMPRSRSPWQ